MSFTSLLGLYETAAGSKLYPCVFQPQMIQGLVNLTAYTKLITKKVKTTELANKVL